jgi:hypothetical protein
MKKLYLVTTLLLIFISSSFSQSFFNARRERSLIFVGGMGLSTYFGELKVGNSFDTKPTLNVGLQYYLSQHISARVDATWFQLTGSDALADPGGLLGRKTRNLSFSSDNLEISATFAYNLFSSGDRYYRRPSLNAYWFTGIGLCYFNPKTEYQGVSYSLPDVKTEGVAYSTFTPVIPIGFGVRFKVNRDVNIAVEGGYRMTFTDYLDDTSSTNYAKFTDPSTLQYKLAYRFLEIDPTINVDQFVATQRRGNPKTNDSYFLLNVKLEYYLPTDFIFGNNQGHRKVQHYKRKKSNYRRAKSR